jgi:hypothetical protein
MVFVPEGQPDSSQARSAWVEMQERPRPGGTVEGMVSSRVPEIICRRNGSPGLNGFKAKIGSIVPLGRGYFPHHPRHFVPGYYPAVPPGQKTLERRGFT